ncbi:MAG TPA: AtpZ/AtpI family protein [Bacteroidia bacterium]|nr:AtpZ/AtpI family protein [Bacteroidia bacterium]
MKTEPENRQQQLSREIGGKEMRKLKAQRQPRRSAWAGFGVFGIVGWSVVVPTLAGAMLGRWVDQKYPQPFSWTLTLMITGLAAGCVMAWRWIKKEHTDMHQKTEDKK